MEDSTFAYANFFKVIMDSAAAERCAFTESVFSEAEFKKGIFSESDLSRADFFKAKLRGVDFSTCCIDGITLSDTFSELKGLKVNAIQAVELAKMLGLKII